MTRMEPTVFVVDDDPAVRNSLCWLISSVKLPVLGFSSAHEFLEAVDPEQHGCVIVDVRMPEMNGFELQAEIRERYPGLSVIVITAHGSQENAAQAMAGGAVGYVQKPTDDEILIGLVQKCF